MSTNNPKLLRGLSENAAVCYLIGAGFSRASFFALPTPIGFFSREWTIPEPGNNFGFTPPVHDQHLGVLDYIQKNYGALHALNLETVLTDLHIRSFGIGRSWEDESIPLQSHYRSLLDYIRERLLVSEIGPSGCPLISRFVKCQRSQDHVLTLNYDTLLESHIDKAASPALKSLLFSSISAIRPFVLGYGEGAPNVFLSHDAKRRGFLAKLHGSIDWNACPNAECPQYSSIENLSQWARSAKDPSGQYRCGTCGSFPETVIIPPVTPKAFERFPKLGIVWHRAHNCIRRSFRFVLMGVSLAVSDFHLASLIRHSLKRSLFCAAKDQRPMQICIVSKDDDEACRVATRLRQILPAQLTDQIEQGAVELLEFASVEDYIKTSEEIDAGRKHCAKLETTSHDF